MLFAGACVTLKKKRRRKYGAIDALPSAAKRGSASIAPDFVHHVVVDIRVVLKKKRLTKSSAIHALSVAATCRSVSIAPDFVRVFADAYVF